MAGFDFGRMFETAEWFRKTWGQMGGVPQTMVPTIDPEELERRIADLRTVEQWLALNLDMLRGTIQGMEVQRHTFVAMRAFGEAASKQAASMPDFLSAAAAAFAMPGQAMPAQAAASPSAAPPATPRPAAPPAAMPAAAMPPARGSASNDDMRVMQGGLEPADLIEETAPPLGTEPGQPMMPPQGAGAPGGAFGLSPDVMLNPTAWWNLLQQQFGQVAGSALAGMDPAALIAAMPASAPGTASAAQAPANGGAATHPAATAPDAGTPKAATPNPSPARRAATEAPARAAAPRTRRRPGGEPGRE